MGAERRGRRGRRERREPGTLTYPEVGATAGPLPAGYHHLERSYPLGPVAAFDDVVAALVRWDVHRGAGLRVPPGAPPAAVGVEVTARAGLGPVSVPVPCRVVYVVEEKDERGFAYGTLPGHPESGEERFVVRRDGGTVWFDVRAFSRPATVLTRLGGPVGRVAQRIVTDRYARAARRVAVTSVGA